MNATLHLSSDQPPTRGRLIYYIHVVVAVISLPIFVFLWIDLVLHPTEITPGLGLGVGFIIGLGNSLLTVIVGILCLRRPPGNSIGAILIMWGIANIGIEHSPSGPTLDWYDVYINLMGG